ncbi:hypothetical protein K466DRAFT_597839 [Polyporus arcularius HHB13444]|uniref:Uncharacterized protein n=1 Tax=Polyporus arcularius HHB13444 TaxID=1314778 RepID=A0A5C3PKD5_9APHY|nr:hypothetical protein K466DRAFT_597839 [Polyporus arcularius HHB13444]
MTRYFTPTFPAHDDPWDHHDESLSLSKPTDKLLSGHSSSAMDPETTSVEKLIPSERRRCCTRLSINWNFLIVALLTYATIFLLTLVLSLAHFFVGARILKYPTDALQYSYTQERHYLDGTTVIRHGRGVTGAFMQALATGSSLMALVLCVCMGFALVLLKLVRSESELTVGAAYGMLTLGSTAVAAVVAGVGVWLKPVGDFSFVHAFKAGGVGFAVLVVPLTLFFVVAGAAYGV